MSRHRIFSASALLASLFVCPLLRAQPSTPVETLYQRFAEQMPNADVVVLLDASGSMDGDYPAVRKAAIDFVKSLSHTETVHVRVFYARVQDPLEARGDEAARRIEAHLPKEPLPGEGTDIGLALDKGIAFLERPDAARVQAMFFLTDGQHQPLPESPYGKDVRTDPNWAALRARAIRLCQLRNVTVYGFGLVHKRAPARNDVDLLGWVFPSRNVEMVLNGPEEVANVLRVLRNRIRHQQVMPLLGKDLADGRTEVTFSQGVLAPHDRQGAVTVRVRNGYRYLPVRLEGVTLEKDSASPEMSCRLDGAPNGVVLAPGQEWTGTLKAGLSVNPPRWGFGQTVKEYTGKYTVSPEASLVDARALKDLEQPQETHIVPGQESVLLQARSGKPAWLFFAVLVSLAVAVAGFLRLKEHRPQPVLFGSLAHTGSVVETVDLAGLGRAEAQIGPGKDISVPITGFAPDGVAGVLSVAEEGEDAALAISSTYPGITVNTEPVMGRRLLYPGDVVQVDGDTLTVSDARMRVWFTHPALLAVGLVLVVMFAVMLVRA